MRGKRPEEIYVVYTPKYSREPSEESWINKNGYSYKNDFGDRFRSLSYRDKIYPWLKNEILPDINIENVYLKSAIEQYIDYLEGMFSIRTIDQPMNMRLQQFIKEELGIHDDEIEESLVILSAKEKELNNTLIQIRQLKSGYEKQIIEKQFLQWRLSLENDFPDKNIVSDNFRLNPDIINLGIRFDDGNITYAAIIEYDHYGKPDLYFGIGRHYSSLTKYVGSHRLDTVLKNNELNGPEDFWYGWKRTSFENAYSDLGKLINEIISSL